MVKSNQADSWLAGWSEDWHKKGEAVEFIEEQWTVV